MVYNKAVRQARAKLARELRDHPAVLGVHLIAAPHATAGGALRVSLRHPLRGTEPPVPAEVDGVGVFTELAQPVVRPEPSNVDIGSLPGIGSPNR